MPKKVFIAAMILLAIAAAVIYFLDPFGNGNELRLSGIVEIQEVRLGSKVGGRVEKVYVPEGVDVYPGDKLLLLESPELTAKRDQLQAQVQSAEAEVERAVTGSRVAERKAAQAAADAALARFTRMKNGWREEEKQQAQSDLESAQADNKQAAEDLDRAKELYRAKSISRAEYDLAVGVHDRTKGRASSAKAKVDMMKVGNRQEDIDEAKAEWEKAQATADQIYKTREEEVLLSRAKLADVQAKLREAQVNLQEALIIVPKELGRAHIEVISVREGDLVQPNQPVIRVLRTQDLWVKVFVPVTRLDEITDGMSADVVLDSGRRMKGTVQQRATISEFTPRNVQSVDERRYMLFGVKIRVTDPDNVLNAGMAATVTFHKTPPR